MQRPHVAVPVLFVTGRDVGTGNDAGNGSSRSRSSGG